MSKENNEHLYEVSDEFQAWWESKCTEPYKPLMEKMLAWDAWKTQQEKIDKVKSESMTKTKKMNTLIYKNIDLEAQVKSLMNGKHETNDSMDWRDITIKDLQTRIDELTKEKPSQKLDRTPIVYKAMDRWAKWEYNRFLEPAYNSSRRAKEEFDNLQELLETVIDQVITACNENTGGKYTSREVRQIDWRNKVEKT